MSREVGEQRHPQFLIILKFYCFIGYYFIGNILRWGTSHKYSTKGRIFFTHNVHVITNKKNTREVNFHNFDGALRF